MITLLLERLNIRLKVWGEINIIVLWNMVIQKKNIGQTLGNFENEYCEFFVQKSWNC